MGVTMKGKMMNIKKIMLLVGSILFIQFYSLQAMQVDVSVHWQSPTNCPTNDPTYKSGNTPNRACQSNQPMFSSSGFPAPADFGKYGMTMKQHVLGPYFGQLTTKLYISRPKSTWFSCWWGNCYIAFDCVKLTRAMIGAGSHGGAGAYGPSGATNDPGVWNYQVASHSWRDMALSLFTQVAGKMELSINNFTQISGVNMSLQDFYGSSIFLPIHLITPGTFVVNNGKDYFAAVHNGSYTNGPKLNNIINMQNNYVKNYPKTINSNEVGF
jgi:hypothetical protein